MKQLPKGWSHQKLGDLIELKYGTALPQKTRTNDGHPVFGSNGKIGEHNPALTSGETLIVGRKGSIGEVHYSPMACTPIDTTYYIDNVPDNTFKYWFHSLKSLNLNKLNKSTAIPGLSRNDVYNIDVPVPPINEQRRIADKLDRVLARVDATNEHLSRVAPLIKRFRQSVLSSAMSGKLTKEWRQINNDLRKWKSTTLGKSAKFIDYRGKTPTKTQQGIPLITAKNVRQGILNKDPQEFINPSDYEKWMTRGLPKPGDVLITTEAPLGNVTLIDWDYKFALAQRLICLHFSKEILGKFAAFQLQSPDFQRALNTNATGSTVTGIQAARLKELEIIVPSLEEQCEIVRRVEKLFALADRLEERLSQAQAAVQKLTPALLAKAFRGELVPQDPNDEPASELLKRLQESRTESTKPSRARKPRARKSP